MRLAALLAVCSLVAIPVYAATINAANCTQTEVQTRVNQAASGDTVVVPSCGSTSWGSSVTISGKKLTIQGQTTCSGTPASSCIDNTNINSGSVTAFNVTVTAANVVDISGFTITGSGGVVSIGAAEGTYPINSYRFHGNHMILTSGRGLEITVAYGLADHNLFVASGSGCQVFTINGGVFGSNTDAGFPGWSHPLSLGTVNASYFEDNTIQWTCGSDSIVDSYIGARWVVRHNNITLNSADFGGGHGTDSGGTRSPVSWEVYNNNFTNNGASTLRAGTLRGGTGVWFNNTFTGNFGNNINVLNYRACAFDFSNWGACDGTNWRLVSNLPSSVWQATTSTGAGTNRFCSGDREKLCLSDSDCSGVGTCSTFFDGSGTQGYLCRDQIGVKPGQTAEPVYGWNNGSTSTCVTGGACNNNVIFSAFNLGLTCGNGLPVSGRDFFNNGTTAKPGYTAFTYPHPMQGVAGPAISFSPTSVAFGNVTVGQPSATQDITVQNTGSASFTISAVALTGTNPGDFSITANACITTLAVSASCIVTVRMTPTVAAARSANVSFTDTAPASPQTVPLSGTGVVSGASVFYVDNSGSPACSDTPGQPGTQAAPWCTIPYAATRIIGGNTVNVKSGTYAAGFTLTGPSGTAGAHTIYQTFPGASVILNGSGFGSGRIKITGGCSFVDFIGFEITNLNQGLYVDDDAGTSVACTNVLVSNVHVHDVGQEGMAIRAGSGSAPRNITIQNSEIDHTGRLGTSNGEGLYIGSSGGVDVTNGVTILKNTIHDTQDECIELKGDSHDNVIDGNNLFNCLSPGSSFGNNGGAIEIDENRNSATTANQLIRNNVIHDLTFNASITKRGIRAGNGATIYNNVLYNINSAYSCILSNNSLFSRLIYHNTVDCGTANAIVNTGTADIRNNIGPATANNIATNNAFYVNQAAANYALVAGSAPIGAGVNLTSVVPTDINGVTRTLPPDLGAFEFTGPVASLSATTLTFAGQAVGSTSATQQATLTNTGSSTLTITSIIKGGTNPTEFNHSTTCGASLAPTASCTITESFTPVATGARSATITFTDNDGSVPASTQTVTLSGTGASPGALILPGSLSFGAQAVGSNSASKPLAVFSNGSGSLTITSITITGSYSQTNNCPASLVSGASCTVNVTFSPASAGAFYGQVTVNTNAAMTTTAVLVGSGQTAQSGGVLIAGGVLISGGVQFSAGSGITAAVCGPPTYNCSITDGANRTPTGGFTYKIGNGWAGHAAGPLGANMVILDQSLADPVNGGNRILRVTDFAQGGQAFYRAYSGAGRNTWNITNELVVFNAQGGANCFYSFSPTLFEARRESCSTGLSLSTEGVEWSGVSPYKFYSWVKSGSTLLFRRFNVDISAGVPGDAARTTSYGFAQDGTFTDFDINVSTCLNGAWLSTWSYRNDNMSNDDSRVAVLSGPSQNNDFYIVVRDATLGCRWLNTKTMQMSNGFNGGLSSPVDATFNADLQPTMEKTITFVARDAAGIATVTFTPASPNFFNTTSEFVNVIGCSDASFNVRGQVIDLTTSPTSTTVRYVNAGSVVSTTAATGTLRFGGFLHSVGIDASGQYVEVGLQHEGKGNGLWTWDPADNVIRGCIGFNDCIGHRQKGWKKFVLPFNSGGNLWRGTRSMAQPSISTLNVNLGSVSTQTHITYNNADSLNSAPYIESTYGAPTPNPPTVYQGEVLGGSLVSGKVWRFAHNFSAGDTQISNPPGNGLGDQGVCQVSQDGKYALCSTDWELFNDFDGVSMFGRGLGDGNGNNTCDPSADVSANLAGCRWDMAIIELR